MGRCSDLAIVKMQQEQCELESKKVDLFEQIARIEIDIRALQRIKDKVIKDLNDLES